MLREIEVENIASLACETNRCPDPHVFEIDYGKRRLLTPDGTVVENFILQRTETERSEYQAFRLLQEWATDENRLGNAVWFSPPFENTQTSKITISEKRGNKLLNRAIVLDIGGVELLKVANGLGNTSDMAIEALRGAIFIPSEDKYLRWFEGMDKYSGQIQMIKDGRDIAFKNTALMAAGRLVTNGSEREWYEAARLGGLFGMYADSCNALGRYASAFEIMFRGPMIGGEKTLQCTCPFCSEQVTAKIKDNKIHCPQCNKSAPYSC